MMRYLSLVLILSAGGAAAQDLQYSDDFTAACVCAQPTLEGQKACIGRSAQACMVRMIGEQALYLETAQVGE